MSDDIATKLAAARTRLILDKPFLGALVMRLPMKAADPKWCKTTATDARDFYYNKAYIDALSLEQTQFVLAHEALHCALSHFNRRQHRLKHRWDVACDLAINPLLIDDGLVPPPTALYMTEYRGMTAEEIYPAIDDLEDQEPMDQHLYDHENDGESSNQEHAGAGESNETGQQGKQPSPGDQADADNEFSGTSKPQPGEQTGSAPQPEPLSDAEKQALAIQWQQRMAGAAQQAMQAGKMGASMARLVDHLLQPQLPWRMLLARYMTAVARDDYSFQRPSRREGDAILPSIHSRKIDIVIILDTSGSISDNEMDEFVSEVDAIKGQLRARITLHACDDKLDENGPWIYEDWENFSIPKNIEGGGATSFKPPFEWLSQRTEPDLLVYFTDAEGSFPDKEPTFPVIWLIKGKQTVPWGQRIQLN